MTDSAAGRRPNPDNNAQLSRREKWLFGTGDLTTSAPLALLSFFYLFFLTDVARLAPGLAALPILVGKLWDAVNDPIVGILADRINSRIGRRRLLLAVGALPVGLSFGLMWRVPEMGTVGMLIYYSVAFIVFDTSFTVVHIAYNSLTPSLTKDYDEQSSIHGIRMFYSIAGSLLAVIIGTVLQWFIDDTGTVFLYLGLVVGAIIIIPPMLVMRVTKDRDSQVAGEQPATLAGIRHVLQNRPFWIVIGIYITSWTAISIIAAGFIYFVSYNIAAPDQANYIVLVAQGMALAFIPVTVWIARRWDKRVSIYIGLGSMLPLLLIIGTIGPGSMVSVYILAALLGLGIATAYVVPWSMIPDIISWDERATGARREASYYAIVSFFQKSGAAFALWIMAQALERFGYVTPSTEVPVPSQPEAVLAAIRHFISTVPVALLAASIVFAIAYPISRSVHLELRRELGEETA